VTTVWEGREGDAPSLTTARAPDSVHYTIEDGTVVVWVDYHRGGVVATLDGSELHVDLIGYRVASGPTQAGWERFEVSGASLADVASVSLDREAEAATFGSPAGEARRKRKRQPRSGGI
jgi:hypothetical protein